MRIAFYAPLKAPSHPVPSGDRLIARLLVAALERAGHVVEVASTLRTFDGAGDRIRQARLRRLGEQAGERAARRLARTRPDAWVTYHLYHKAPDWTGPLACRRLGVPYVIVEASYAAKQSAGPWGPGLVGVREALQAARTVVALKSVDLEGVRPHLARGTELVPMAPFLDASAIAGPQGREFARSTLAARLGLHPGVPWLVALAMLRPGEKAASYAVLAAALARLRDRPWQLAVVGDGPAREAVRAGFTALGADRVRMAGAWSTAEVAQLLCGFDVLTWPAVGEAIGMALLEAAAAGLPVVSATSGGVTEIVRDGRTGVLAAPGDDRAFAAGIDALLADPGRRRRLGAAGYRAVRAHHSMETASRTLDGILARATEHPVR